MMPRYANITDELLSAYLDDAVTTSERALVEAAVADDPDIAWRLATLQHTVSLLGRLPDIPLPRAFALTEAMVAEPMTEGAGVPIPASIPRPRSVHEPEKIGFWQAWRSFWQGGNVLMRNAAAASFAAFLVLAVAGATFSTQSMSLTSTVVTLPNTSLLEANQIQSADSLHVQPAASMQSAPPEAAMMRRELDATAEESRIRNTPSPREAPAALVMESAPAEPIPLPAESVDEAQGAIASADESIAPPEAERAAAEAKNAAEVLSAAAAPIAAASIAVADESAPAAEMEVDNSTADHEAAPMAMVAPAGDETVETSADAAAMDNSVAEEIAQADAVEETSVETSEIAVADDANIVAESADVDSVAMAEVEMKSSVANDDVEDTPATAPAPPPPAEQAAPAPVEKAGGAEPALGTQAEAPMTTSASTMNVLDADPLRFVQLIALGLTLLFAALWLLSRRTQSSPQ